MFTLGESVRRLPIVVLIAGATVLAACGTSGGSDATATTAKPDTSAEVTGDQGSDPQEDPMAMEYEAAIVTQFTKTDDDELTLSTSQAECVAPKWVEAMTVERLEENNVTVEDLSDTSFNPGDLSLGPETGEMMITAFADCDVDIAELLIESIAGSDTELSTCLTENLDAEVLLDLLARDIGGEDTDEEFNETFDPVGEKCEDGG